MHIPQNSAHSLASDDADTSDLPAGSLGLGRRKILQNKVRCIDVGDESKAEKITTKIFHCHWAKLGRSESQWGIFRINWPELLAHTRDHFHTHNLPHRAHHEDEARGSTSELPGDNWIHLRTVSWHDSGLHTLQEARISVFPPRTCSRDDNDKKLNKRHQPAPSRCHGDRKRTKNHRYVNNRWQWKTLTRKSRDGTKPFKTEDQWSVCPNRRHQSQLTVTSNAVKLDRVFWVNPACFWLHYLSILGVSFLSAVAKS